MTTSAPSHAASASLDHELVRRATELQPLLATNAARTEADRRVVEENIQAMRDAGLFKLMVPKRLGGYETTIRTKIEVSAALAEGCGSTAWINALTNVCAWLTSLLPEQGQLDIFGADPDARVAGVIAPSTDIEKVEGGYVVSGRWAWSSGCLHATWALAGVLQLGPDGTPIDLGDVFMPMDELTIEDTWYVAGMRGTGSNTIIADRVFVPEHRYLSAAQALQGITPTPFKDEALYRAAFAPVLVLILVGPLLGLGRAALKIALDKAPKRAVSYTRIARQADSTAFQTRLSEAAMMLDTATLHAHRAADDIDRFAARGEEMDYLTKTRVKADTGWVSRNVRRAIDTILDAHGASGFADSSPMQRIWRDANTAGRHAVVNPLVTEEVYGKALLGIGPEDQITDLI
jgi:3-hydroxy-9,10-secoandrosta-1,3,5(10)-triene-9,17-dione monooxygenase